MFKSLFELTKDVVDVVTAPVEVVLDIADAAVKPIAEAARDIVVEVKDELKD